jgi:hypothetical protein
MGLIFESLIDVSSDLSVYFFTTREDALPSDALFRSLIYYIRSKQFIEQPLI